MEARIVAKDPGAWSNKHRTFTQPVEALYDVWNPTLADGASPVEGLRATVRALGGLVREAVRDGARLRAVGSGWSISEVAATGGRVVNTKPLNWLFSVSPGSVSPAYAGDREGLVFAQCGASVAQLDEHLAARGRALRAHGASNGQTVVGAFSTGSHGSAIDGGALQDGVVGLHLVVGGERHVWLERASYPVASASFVGRLETELVRDDALFEAALVGLGAFGIVHAALLETEPLFLLEAHRARAPLGGPLGGPLRDALGRLDFGGLALPDARARPHHFDVVVNPYDLDRGAYYTVMYRRPYRDDYDRIEGGDWGLRPGDDFLHVAGVVSDEVPALIPGLVNGVMNARYRPYAGRTGTLGEVFSYNTIHGRASTGSAVGVPLGRAAEALDLLLETAAAHGPFAGVLGLRYVRASRGLLAFTRFPVTCVIDLDGVDSARTRAFFEHAWDALAASGIPHAYHWGKAGPFDAARLRTLYGPALDGWRAARRHLLGPAVAPVFASPFLERAGLDAVPAGPPLHA